MDKIDGDEFFPIKTWPTNTQLEFYRPTTTDKGTFILLLFFIGNGANPYSISDYILLSQPTLKRTKRLNQILWILTNLDHKKHLWFYFDIHHSTELFLDGRHKPQHSIENTPTDQVSNTITPKFCNILHNGTLIRIPQPPLPRPPLLPLPTSLLTSQPPPPLITPLLPLPPLLNEEQLQQLQQQHPQTVFRSSLPTATLPILPLLPSPPQASSLLPTKGALDPHKNWYINSYPTLTTLPPTDTHNSSTAHKPPPTDTHNLSTAHKPPKLKADIIIPPKLKVDIIIPPSSPLDNQITEHASIITPPSSPLDNQPTGCILITPPSSLLNNQPTNPNPNLITITTPPPTSFMDTSHTIGVKRKPFLSNSSDYITKIPKRTFDPNRTNKRNNIFNTQSKNFLGTSVWGKQMEATTKTLLDNHSDSVTPQPTNQLITRLKFQPTNQPTILMKGPLHKRTFQPTNQPTTLMKDSLHKRTPKFNTPWKK